MHILVFLYRLSVHTHEALQVSHTLSKLSCSVQASRGLVDHTSTQQFFIVPFTVVMETESMWHRGRGNGGQRLWAPGPIWPLHAWHHFLISHTHTHILIYTYTLLHTTCLSLLLFWIRYTHIYESASHTVVKTHTTPASVQMVGNPGHVEHILKNT